MKKYLILILLGCALLHPFSAKAVIPLTDPPQAVQAILRQAQTYLSTAQTYVNAASAVKRRILNGYYGARQLLDIDRLNALFQNKFKELTNKQIDSLVGDKLQSLVGSNISGKLNIDDITSINVDDFKALGKDKLNTLTDEQLKNLLGPSLSGKLTRDQIQSLVQNPDGLWDFIQGVSSSQSAAPKTDLEAIGITGNSLADNTTNGGTGPNSNRSDAFSGTGNGSTAQATKSKEAFEKTQKMIVENLQIPTDAEALNKITSEKINTVKFLQMETAKELGTRGLATAWIRQAVQARTHMKQEAEGQKRVSEAKDVRGNTQAVSEIALMAVEALTYANSTFAMDLTVTASTANQKSGPIRAQILDAPVQTTNTGGSAASGTTTPTQSGQTGAGPSGGTTVPSGQTGA